MSQPDRELSDLDHFFIGEARRSGPGSNHEYEQRTKEAAVTVELSDGSRYYYERSNDPTDEGLVARGAFYEVNNGGSLSIFYTRDLYKNNSNEDNNDVEKTKARMITFGPGAWFSVKGAEA